MKTQKLFALCTFLLACLSINAAKTVYIPSSWNLSGTEYIEDGDSNKKWSYTRSKESDNCIVFWAEGFGADPTTRNDDAVATSQRISGTFSPDDVLAVAEKAYAKNVNDLGFSCSNMLNKYKLLILVSYTDDWVCYGGGYDFECSALWIAPSAVSPAGHSLAHEVGHSFHYMAYSEAVNYNHTSSSTNNTGFHLACGNGQAVWEQTAQWQANQSYPAEMFGESYPLFGNNVNYSFSHEWMRYQSYWFFYYLCEKYNDLTTIAKVWKHPMDGQSNGDATDFCQALMSLKGLSAAQFYEMYFEYALKCATYDFTAATSYRNDYVGKFDYYASKLGTGQYQVAYHSAPQSTGFNVIELEVPSSGTTITTQFTALQHGCALAADDPATYNNGVAGANVPAKVSSYNSAGNAADRGFRVGYVFLLNNGTRQYVNDNTVHCTGTSEKTENISATVPANTSRIFLVVTPSLTNYFKHLWDENIKNDDQWPYRFQLVGTDVKNATIVEKAPEEPEFTKAIDGRKIANVTLTYKVILPVDDTNYTAATVMLNGSGENALSTAFQLSMTDINSKLVTYTSTQPTNGQIMGFAVATDGTTVNYSTSTAESGDGDFGHWFDAAGNVTSWGNSPVYSNYKKAGPQFNVGQMPGLNSDGTTRTIRQAMAYKDTNGNTATAYFVFNITFKANASPIAYLTQIDYTKPTGTVAGTTSVTVNIANAVDAITLKPIVGGTASYTLTTGTRSDMSKVTYGLGSITDSYVTSSSTFKGYTATLSTATTGNNVYYYALSAAPTTNNNGFKYYSTKSVTDDADFNSNTYVHYYNENGKVIAAKDAATAAFKIGYEYNTRKFTVKVAESCPAGSYTVYLAMARRYKSGNNTRIGSSYFPITVVVQSKPEETIEVERPAETGYTQTIVSVQLDAAKEYLGVVKITTDMLYFVNPDGTEIAWSDYKYDGWCDESGAAKQWGDSTKICVKFFQIVDNQDNPSFYVGDMNNADVVGSKYSVKWAIKSGGLTYTFTIVTTFVEKEYASYTYNSLNVRGGAECRCHVRTR